MSTIINTSENNYLVTLETSPPGPQGPQGPQGETGPAVSEATPQPIGTAAAGVSTTASRDDHIHALPAHVDITELQLTGGTGTQGTMAWDTDQETVSLVMNGDTTYLNQELFYHVRNLTPSTIAKGTWVQASGTVGASGRITVSPMDGSNKAASKYLLGVTHEDIAPGADGKVMALGKLRGVDTSAWSDGAVLWISPDTPGELTATEPELSELALPVAFVIHAANNGTLAVRVTPYDEHADYHTGYFDLEPVWAKDDGSGGWAFVVLPSGRRALAATNTGGAKTMVMKYHVPHDIKLGQQDGEAFFHLHTDFEDQTAGDCVIVVTFFAALANGPYSSPFTLTYTMTPANYATNTNHIIELPLPTGLAAYLEPDAIIDANLVRTPGAVADTYEGDIYFVTADFHVQGDSRLTTSKDKGAGWVKA
jgi:hypothetical protein